VAGDFGQADGRLDLIDARTDMHGLGAVFYHLLTGRSPFDGEDTPAVLQDHARSAAAAPPAGEKGAGGTGSHLPQVLSKACEARYRTGRAQAARNMSVASTARAHR
jgi:hypothetical protein